MTCAPHADWNQPAHPDNLIRVIVLHMEKLCILDYPKFATMWRFWDHANQNLRWAYISEGMFSDVMARMFLSPCITKTCLFRCIENFTSKNRKKIQIKISAIFRISAQNIDCRYSLEPPRRGGSNEYPRSMFLSRNKKNNVYPCKPQFYYIKVGFKGVKII